MNITLEKIVANQYTLHNETMSAIDSLNNDLLYNFDAVIAGQERLYNQQFRNHLETLEWFHEFDIQQKQVITALAISKHNQEFMIESLNNLHTKVMIIFVSGNKKQNSITKVEFTRRLVGSTDQAYPSSEFHEY